MHASALQLVHVDALQLVWVVLTWIVLYQAARVALVIAHRESLVCWSVGPLGISAVYLRRPPAAWMAAQVGLPALVVGCAGYVGLFVLHPIPIGGLDLRPAARLGAAALVGLAAAALAGVRLLGDVRFPLWGEARVLAHVQRSRALGGLVLFTRAGRTFLRERYGATPREFLRAVR
jgi:hypothetical protein